MVLSESTRLSEEAKAPGCIYADRNQLEATIKTSIALIPYTCFRVLKASAGTVRRARLSRVVTAALLSEVAEVVALPDLRSEVPEDRVRDRNVEEEVG